jgi:hypothetical protein
MRAKINASKRNLSIIKSRNVCYFAVVMQSLWECPEGGGGCRIPISQPKFWLNTIVPEHKSHHLSGCPAQILIPFPFSIVFLLMNPSPNAWNPTFPPKNKQIPVPILPLQDPLIMQTLNWTNQFPLFITVRHIFEISEYDHPPNTPTPLVTHVRDHWWSEINRFLYVCGRHSDIFIVLWCKWTCCKAKFGP